MAFLQISRRNREESGAAFLIILQAYFLIL